VSSMTSPSSEQTSSRDHRVDFLRGLALAMIFINHIPGNPYANFTTINFGFSDAAEIFVLLAGFASANAYFPRFARGERWSASIGALKRSAVLYVSHILTTMMAVARPSYKSAGRVVIEVARKILLHPFVVATALGVASAAFHIEAPVALDRLLQFLQNASAPCARNASQSLSARNGREYSSVTSTACGSACSCGR